MLSTAHAATNNKRRLYLATSKDGGMIFDPDRDRLLKLNIVGLTMWQMLATGTSEAEIITSISERYGVEQHRVHTDLQRLILTATTKGLDPASTTFASQQATARSQNEYPASPWYGQDATQSRSRPTFFMIARALIGLGFYHLILSCCSLKALCTAVERWPVSNRRLTISMDANRRTTLISQVCSAVEVACIWFPKINLCLPRTAVTACLLRSYGIPARMVLGTRAMPVQAHIWVEVDGCVINDFPRVTKFYDTVVSY
jgi:hypothetical protein